MFHGVREPLVFVAPRRLVGGLLRLGVRVAHGDAEARVVEHENVVRLVADGGDLLRLEVVTPGQVAGDLALVGLRMRDVEVVGLGGRRCHVVPELLHGRLGRRVDGAVVVADADELDDTVGEAVDALHHLGVELDRPGFPVDVRALGVGDVPVRAAVEPDVEVEGPHVVGDRLDDVFGQRVLLQHLQVGFHDKAAVEGRNGRFEVERLHQHLHAPGRPATGHREEHTGLAQGAHGGDGVVGEDLVLGDQRSVDIGEEEADGRLCWSLGPAWSVAMGRW